MKVQSGIIMTGMRILKINAETFHSLIKNIIKRVKANALRKMKYQSICTLKFLQLIKLKLSNLEFS